MTEKGRFCWADLMTPNEVESKDFYTNVLNWKWQAMDMGPEMGVYNMFGPTDDNQQGGLVQIREEMGEVPPHWIPYVTVADVDATVAKAKELGGGVLVEAMDIPNIGRWATITDDQGAAIAIIALSEDEGAPGRRPATGEFCWATLGTKDVAKATAFYNSVFGWEVKEIPMGGGHTQSIIFWGEEMIAGLNVNADPNMPCYWMCAIAVDDLDAAQAKAVEGGANVIMPPMDAGAFGRFNVIADPHGAAISFFQAAAEA